MKNIILIIIIIVAGYLNLSAENISEASRFIKLANTYIQSDNLAKADEYLNKARELIGSDNSWDGQYWRAAIDETYGNYYMKLNNAEMAKFSFNQALNKYKKLIKMHGGSQDALEALLEHTSTLENSLNILSGNTKIVSLDNQKLKQIPSLLPQNMESFSCNNCKLREFPNQLTTYKNLKTLILSNNNMKEFQANQFSNLTMLDLSNNKIKQIDGDFAQNMPHLEYLFLQNNSIKELALSITNMKKLKVLNISGNKIPFSTIQSLIQALPNTLIIHDNYILEEEAAPAEEPTE
ncbi:MAG TPA: leucine-rich repeat domain-containing protein [Candidatus Kapabacteria bacterium]|nr:leucine-rich repeat protein [Candidatus Kapabacteria bacterium]HOV92887.1 leucine-rich repeat domain-containing protein [Candidatus Kapabacteria bacterium]